MTTVPADYEPPETTPQIASLRAYVERREHADHDTFSMGREFAELLLAEYDRLLHLAEVKYELLTSERGYDIAEYLKPKIEKLYMTLNTEARGQAVDLDGDEVAPETKWNRLVEATATAMVHWLANARWAVLEHRSADKLRAEVTRVLDEGLGCRHDFDPECARCEFLAPLKAALVAPEKPEGAVNVQPSADADNDARGSATSPPSAAKETDA